jgi:uroporphyrin-III C-methyltransferase/precorrin-2 dehydrogenase/sirohydrochlorin ferrochelatase
VDRRVVLLAGGGESMLRKARLLASFGARLRVVSPAPDAALAALAETVHRRPFAAADLDGAVLAFADGADADTAAAVVRLAGERGIPVNVPDRADLSSFLMPAVVDRAPITIAIGSGGAAPVLVRRLRERLEAALEPELGRLSVLLDRFRGAVRSTRADETARRRFWEAVVDGPVAARVLAGDEAGATAAMLRALNDPGYGQERMGRVSLVGTGPGDPDLLTLKALRVIQDADVVVHDASIDARILPYVRRDARRIFAGPAADAASLAAAEALAGNRVARLMPGDPPASGGHELEALRAAGIETEIVPGVHMGIPAEDVITRTARPAAAE